nr:hypothetical protein [Chthoniobacterales bacterium]
MRRHFLPLAVAAAIACAHVTFAQDAPPAPSPALLIPAAALGADPTTATRAWLDTVPADKKAKSDAYFEGGYWLLLWNFLLTAAISLLLLNTGISARLRDFADGATRFKTIQVTIYGVAY